MWIPEKIFGFPDSQPQALSLATELGVDAAQVDLHRFPDGESRVRIDNKAKAVAIYRPLHNPNEKLIEVLLAASALRDSGAREVALIAPYLPCMRQDIAFNPGEAVSQKVVGSLLSAHFDRFVAVDPHLHRTATLSAVFENKPSLCISASEAIAHHISSQKALEDIIILGPDIESEPMTSRVANFIQAPWFVARKVRHGDRKVTISLENPQQFENRNIIIVDDVISSGGTMLTLTELLQTKNASSIDIYTTHALFDEHVLNTLRKAGVRRLISCDSVPHPTNGISLTRSISESLRSWQ